MRFIDCNVNPKNKKTGDCATRAVCQACNIPYKQAAKELFDAWMETGVEMTDKKTVGSVLKNHGFERYGKPRHEDGSTFSVRELADAWDGYVLVVQVANHWTCVKSGSLLDLWDCSGKSVYGFFAKAVRDPKEAAPFGRIKL